MFYGLAVGARAAGVTYMYTIFTYQMCISSNKTNLKYNNFVFNWFF